MKTNTILATLVALALGFPNSAEAAITFFTDRVAWQSAAGAASFTENFSAFPVETPFHTSPAKLNAMTIQQEGTERMAFNEVDVPPLQFTPNSGGNSALLLVNFPEGGSSGIQVRITFTGLNRAFGFDSWSGNDSEGAVLDVFSGATLLGSRVLTGGDRDFLGYVLTGVDTSTSVRFRSGQLVEGMIGERFYIDNLAGTTASTTPELAKGGYIYWSEFDGGTIRRANLDGTAKKILVSGLTTPVGPALNPVEGKMYWGDAYVDMRRANLDGTGQTILVGSSGGGPALDLVGDKMYWNDPNGFIRRANLNGTGQQLLVTGQNNPHAVALNVAAGEMYWPEFGGGKIWRANLDGTGKTILVQGLARPNLMTLDIAGGKMYWTGQESGDIRRANLDGSAPEILIQSLNAPAGIALDLSRGHIYWSEYGGGTIRRSNLDGTGKTNLITGLSGPGMITLDLSPLRTPDIQTATRTDSTFTLSWSALMGRSYQVQFKPDLTQTNWSNLVLRLTATNTTMTFLDSAVAEPQRFYRISLLP